MKVRAKLGLLLFAVVATFVAGLVALKFHEREKFRAISATRQEEREHSFDEFREHWGEAFEIFVNYFSAWDDMVTAIERGDRAWAEANITDTTLTSYRAHAVWAYHPDGTIAFTRNLLYSDALATVPLPPGAMQKLLDGPRRCHFFAKVPRLGLMEINGATVHPSDDGARVTPRRGYFLAGRLWSNAELHEMSIFTGNEIAFAPPDAAPRLADALPGSRAVSFIRVLPGWDGAPIAALSIRNDSPIVARMNRSSERLFYWVLGFALVLFLALLISLRRWVSRPLKTLSICLQKQDPECLEPLQKMGDEFGDFARLVGAFFEQRETLIRETAERLHTEEALRDSEERLRHSQKMDAVGRLAGGIAHDFNNLLTAIIGYAELIGLRAPAGTTREEAGLILKAGQQAADLTRQLLAFSRKQILQPRVIDLNNLVREMEKLLRRVIGEQIDLRVALGAREARVFADPTQLEQVLINLGVNARDAMQRGGVLTMHTGERLVTAADGGEGAVLSPGRYITLAVQDTGCGMDADTRGRIFEPFFTTKAPGKGTGLGLATVYGIVSQSGGAITVESELGKGATFTLHLPRADAPVDPPPAQLEPVAKRTRGETVLVVEDEEIVRELVCAVLSDQGYVLLCASNGEDGLRIAQEHAGPIDLLVSDVVMPRMTGPEFAAELLLARPLTKLLFVSGYSDAEIAEDGVLAAGVQFLQKPFTTAVLSRKVREVLDAPPSRPSHPW